MRLGVLLNSFIQHGMAHAARFLAIGLLAFVPQFAAAQSGAISGRVQPGIWIDPDGCMHWVADGGLEG